MHGLTTRSEAQQMRKGDSTRTQQAVSTLAEVPLLPCKTQHKALSGKNEGISFKPDSCKTILHHDQQRFFWTVPHQCFDSPLGKPSDDQHAGQHVSNMRTVKLPQSQNFTVQSNTHTIPLTSPQLHATEPKLVSLQDGSGSSTTHLTRFRVNNQLSPRCKPHS